MKSASGNYTLREFLEQRVSPMAKCLGLECVRAGGRVVIAKAADLLHVGRFDAVAAAKELRPLGFHVEGDLLLLNDGSALIHMLQRLGGGADERATAEGKRISQLERDLEKTASDRDEARDLLEQARAELQASADLGRELAETRKHLEDARAKLAHLEEHGTPVDDVRPPTPKKKRGPRR